MSRLGFALIVLLAACAPSATAPQTASPSLGSPISTETATGTPRVTATLAPTQSVTPVATASPGPTEKPQTDYAVAPKVGVAQAVFPIMTTLRLKLATVDESVVSAATWGVSQYLFAIDAYRNGQSPALPITGRFLAAVSTSLKESAEPGVQRKFEIEALTVDRHVQKPWGTHAYVDVTVTLVDRAVNGNAPDQRETGKLRLTGDKMFVTDGWDYANDRWFNGFGPLSLEQVRTGVAAAVQSYLWLESWTANTSPPALTWNTGTAFQQARTARVKEAFAGATSQLFEGVSATIEQFETIDGVWSGVATVHVMGTAITTNTSGKSDRLPFDRHVRAFVLGNWAPEVVDDQLPQRDWTSGGELALDKVDVNRA